MSTSTSFKQECPFCEALVPIRDPKLVGKKIKCPKCEGPFVVKAPAEDEDEADKSQAITDKKPKPADRAKPGAKKPGKFEAKGAADSKRQKKRNMLPLLLGGGLGVAGIAVLAIVLIMWNSDPPRPTIPTPPQNPVNNQKPADPNEGKTAQKAEEKKEEPKVLVTDPTNLLPADTTSLFSINFDKVRDCGALVAALQQPGTINKESFKELFGFPVLVEDGRGIARVVTALNSKDRWVFSVLRTTHPLDTDDMIKRLKLEQREHNRHRYYMVRRNFDSFGNLLFKANQAHDELALHFVDAQTLIFADVAPLKQFLAAAPPAAAEVKKPGTRIEWYKALTPELRVLVDKVDRSDAPGLVVVAGEPDGILLPVRSVLSTVVKKGAQEIRDAIGRGLGDEIGRHIYAAAANPESAVARIEQSLRSDAVRAAISLTGLTQRKLSLAGAVELKNESAAVNCNLTAQAIITQYSLPVPGMPPGAPKREAPFVVGTFDNKFVAGTATLQIADQAAYDQYKDDLAQALIQAGSVAELASAGPRYHQLAAALAAYVEKNGGHFPRGTAQRKQSLDRDDPREPQNRVSWLAELLPYLPESSFAGATADPDRDWFRGKNQSLARIVIPHFVVRGRDTAFRTTYPSVPGEFGVTHFIGIAGRGLDAASYRPDEKAVADRIGVFGYDRVTMKTAIPKPDKVIAILQVPPEYHSPWLAGGGATVRGVADDLKTGVQPFVTAEYKGKRGTFAIMADFRVRFIPADLPPTLFQAMCTLKGPDKDDGFDELVPVVPDADIAGTAP